MEQERLEQLRVLSAGSEGEQRGQGSHRDSQHGGGRPHRDRGRHLGRDGRPRGAGDPERCLMRNNQDLFQFCADYSIKHFIPSLKISVQKLKLLTCSLNSSEKLALYEKHFDIAPKCVLKYLQISDFNTSKPQTPTKRDSSKDESDTNERSAEKSDIPDAAEVTKTPSLMSRCQIVMSSRNKSLEELPSKSKKHQSEEEKDTVEFRSRTPPKYKPRSKSKVFSSEKKKLNKSKSSSESETDITDFIKDGEILYSKLIKYEISKFDSFLLEDAKKTNNIGGNISLYQSD